jgi:hypothetical protein
MGRSCVALELARDDEIRGEQELVAELGPAAPLSDREKAVLAPGLLRRGLTPALLDVMHTIPGRTRILKVRDQDGALLGACSVLLTPRLFMKHCFGEGNHIGSNSSFFFGPGADQGAVLTAMLQALLRERSFGTYVGIVDAALVAPMQQALVAVPHLVGARLLEAGGIAVAGARDEGFLLERHNHLRRQLHRFRNRGGVVEVHEGALPASVAGELVECCAHSYQRHAHPGRPIDVAGYTGQVHAFATSFQSAVHFCARLDGKLVGIQSFVRHPRHLELSEGGFLAQTYHAYEAIMVASVRWAAGRGLERVNYGLINNPAKDRLMDPQPRAPIFLVMLFRSRLAAALAAPYRWFAHRRLRLPYWRPRSAFAELAL